MAKSSSAGARHLLALPRELRDEIYTLTVLSNPFDHVDEHGTPAKFLWSSTAPRRFRPPPITQVNRQIRTEASEIYYKHTLFLDSSEEAKDGFEWLKSLGAEAKGEIRFFGLVEREPFFSNAIMSFGHLRAPGLSPYTMPEIPPPIDRAQLREEIISLGLKREAVRHLTGEGHKQFEVEEEDGSKKTLRLRSPWEVCPRRKHSSAVLYEPVITEWWSRVADGITHGELTL